MQRIRSEFSRFWISTAWRNMPIFIAAFLFVSACQTRPHEINTVSTGQIELGEGSDWNKNHQISVSKIEVIAPPKGYVIFDKGIRQATYYKSSLKSEKKFRSTYVLDASFNKIVRNFGNEILKFDKNSNNSAKIVADVRIEGGYGRQTRLCHVWHTTTIVELQISISRPGQVVQRDEYKSNLKKTDCTGFGIFLESETLGENIQTALKSIIEEIYAANKYRKI